MKTFHEWLAERTATQSEGLWLNDKLAVPGLSNVNPLNKSKCAELKPPKPFRPPPPATFKAKPSFRYQLA